MNENNESGNGLVDIPSGNVACLLLESDAELFAPANDEPIYTRRAAA